MASVCRIAVSTKHMSINPYEAPLSPQLLLEPTSEFEQVRKDHIKHEASVKSVGLLYWLGGIGIILSGAAVGVGGAFRGGAGGQGGLGILEIGMVIGLLLLGALYLWVGSGLRKFRKSARIITGIFSGFGLLGFPIGTLINGYILYLILGKKGAMVFSDHYKDVIAATPYIKYKTSVVVWIILGGFILAVVSLLIWGILSK